MQKDGQDNITDTMPEDLGGGDPGGGVDPAEDPVLAAYIENLLPHLPVESLEKIREVIAQAIMYPGEWIQTTYPNAYKTWSEGKEARNAFILSLTAEDFTNQYSDSEIPEKIKEVFTSGTDAEKLEAFGHLPPLVFFELCESKQGRKRTYRTAKRAHDTNENLPEAIAIPTLPALQYAASFFPKGDAYLAAIGRSVGNLIFKNGKIFFEGRLQAISEAELQNMKTEEGIQDIDLIFLKALYSIILSEFESKGNKKAPQVIRLRIPRLAEYMGKSQNISKTDLETMIAKVQQFHNIVGIMHITRNGRPDKDIYPVLNFEGYSAKENVISFSSPYMNHVIETAYNISIRKDKKGETKLKKNGEPQRIASHSYLVRSEIAKEKNKKAAENVFIIVQLIEQAGDNVPRIRASTIIERNRQLAEALETNQNPHRLLKTTFKKTWELLQTKTKLQEVYKNIQLPDPNDPANIPTPKNIDALVFEFPHEGKKPQV